MYAARYSSAVGLALCSSAASSARRETGNMRSGVPNRNESRWLRGSNVLNPALPHAASDWEHEVPAICYPLNLLRTERLRCRGLEKENLRGSLAFMAQRITIIKGPGPRSPNRIYHRRARMAHNQTTERKLRLAQVTRMSMPCQAGLLLSHHWL